MQHLEPEKPFDPYAITRAVADDLRKLYGERLRHVVLFGSWARGDAHPESDIDLVVVLDEIDDRSAERQRISDVMWKHSFDNDAVVSALTVSEADFDHSNSPALIRARLEGRMVA